MWSRRQLQVVQLRSGPIRHLWLTYGTLTLSLPIPLRLYTLPYWSDPPVLIFLTFGHSGTHD